MYVGNTHHMRNFFLNEKVRQKLLYSENFVMLEKTIETDKTVKNPVTLNFHLRLRPTVFLTHELLNSNPVLFSPIFSFFFRNL